MVDPAVWGVIVAFALMVASNVLAQKKVFGGKDNKEISDTHPTYLSPDGTTFAIWGMIYLFLSVTVVAQFFAKGHEEQLLTTTCPLTGLDARTRLILAFLANAIWLPLFNNEFYWVSLGIMLVYLAFLISYYYDVNPLSCGGFWTTLKLSVGVSMNLSWIVVATGVQKLLCFGEAGWKDEHGVAGSSIVGVLGSLLVAALGCERIIMGHDFAFGFVSVWAIQGIRRMQTKKDAVRFPVEAMNKVIASACQVGSATILAAFLYRLFF